MAETYDPEIAALLDTYRGARRKAQYQRAWQGIGAFADSYLTGRPGIDALNARAAPRDYWTADEKIAATTPILRQKEEALREWGVLATQTEMKIKELQGELGEARLTGANVARGDTITATKAKADLALEAVALKHKDLQTAFERGNVLDPKAREAMAAATEPQGQERDDIQRLAFDRALQGEGLVADSTGRVFRVDQATGETKEVVGDQMQEFLRTAGAIEKDLTEVVRQGGGTDPALQEIAARNMANNGDALIAQLRSANPAMAGQMALVFKEFAAMTGSGEEQLLALVEAADPNLARAVLDDRQAYAGEIASLGAAVKVATVNADQAVRSIGGNMDPVRQASDNLLKMTQDLQGNGLAGPAETPGEPGGAEAIGAPGAGGGETAPAEAMGATGAPAMGGGGAPAPQAPTPQEALAAPEQQDPQRAASERNWARLGYQGPPPDSGIEVLDGIIRSIEERPEIPAVQRAKQALQNSDQFVAWKAKHGVTVDSPLVFNQFLRDARSKVSEARRTSEQHVMDGVRAGTIGGGGVIPTLRNIGVDKAKAEDRYKARLKTAAPDRQQPEEPPLPEGPAPVR